MTSSSSPGDGPKAENALLSPTVTGETTPITSPSESSFLFPQELIDSIIDWISERPKPGKLRNLTTLRACSLVATAWTARAQRRIFQWVDLCDAIALRRFSLVLRTTPHLTRHVEGLTLMRRLDRDTHPPPYSPNCVENLFPSLLAGHLPNLRSLVFDVVYPPEEGMSSFRNRRLELVINLKTSDIAIDALTKSHRASPFLPMHTCFPLLLSSFSSINELELNYTVFLTFNDFARVLHAFKQLRILRCIDVTWITSGVLLPSFMTATSTPRNGAEDAFLPHLEVLTACRLGKHGPERLLLGLALAASVRDPNVHLFDWKMDDQTDALVDPATGRGPGLDLSPFPHLSFVSIGGISPYLSRAEEVSTLTILHMMLASWNACVPRILTLWISPSPRESNKAYTKEDFFSFLDEVGTRVEEGCTSRRGSTIPKVSVLLDVPRDANTSLEDLKREVGTRFPMALKAQRLMVDCYLSNIDDFSWDGSILAT